MSPAHVTDANLTPKNVSGLTSKDALAAFFADLGYDTSRRSVLTPESVGLAGDSAAPIKEIEVLSEDEEGFLRVVFVQLRSLTAKSRNDLSRVLGRTSADHLLVLTSDFGVLEFVLLQKRQRESRGPVKTLAIQVVPLTVAIDRKAPSNKDLRTLRRFTWTTRDGLEQYDKLRTVFESAAFTEEYFCNRALFADYYLLTRLREDAAWRDNPSEVFHQVRGLFADARRRWLEKPEQIIRDELFLPLFELLGFAVHANKPAKDGAVNPDFTLTSKGTGAKTVAFVYPWDRWLDGPDFHLDVDSPSENPGACVVTALEEGSAEWIIVTNGRQWRLYSRNAHSRATNFYEVDLAEALVASGDTDPNEAFRYWWLFFRAEAFTPLAEQPSTTAPKCWLDRIAEESRDYAKALGERLKNRVFVEIFPHLAQGFLADRKARLGIKKSPTEEELTDVFQATLTLLYRLLFLLFAESRDLLPIREAPYREASLRKIKEQIADKGGIAESESAERLKKAFSATECGIYDRLALLFAAMDRGDASLNVPVYNGGLFITKPGEGNEREQRIARFLGAHKVPDRYLALAVDRLARDPDDKTFSLVPIDYKSLEVRHLGSIYEGLLEFKLRVAEEDLTTAVEKKKEKYIPLGQAKAKRGKQPVVEVRKGEVYLSNDKAERKASGSYYTPDPIVEYIVEHTVGPVLAEKLEKLRPEFRKVRKTYDNELQKVKAFPVKKPSGDPVDPHEFAGEKTYVNHKQLVEQLFDFRTLDPAMGSGHFLVEAVDFITDRLLAWLNQFPVNPVTFMLNQTRERLLTALQEQGVTVDAEKLTEVNLLKRHVLKRCIYGVDLNPMAVELAKVSLWLDAFTIGAPLSFLDHHLRCGNSLIGATFADLAAAIKGQLFGIDYQPLLRAIHHVLYVNTMSDATAAEVKQSASEYAEARNDLSGYQVVLDLLVAKYFGVPEGVDLLKRGGQDLDLSSRAKFRQSLEDLDELAIVERVEQVATEPGLRFFHWEIEFPEVFFGFADADQRQLKHKNEIVAGSAGFDTVVGNPPYVRQESIRGLKEYFKSKFSTFHSANDIYVYFQEQEILALRDGSRMAMIVANKWMRAGYGASIRRFLKAVAKPETIIDFGHSPIFPDADTFPCVLIVTKREKILSDAEVLDLDEKLFVSSIPREDWNSEATLRDCLSNELLQVSTRLLQDETWSIDAPQLREIHNLIRTRSLPLSHVTGSSPMLGLKTGFNEAFVVDDITSKTLLKHSHGSQKLLRPLVRGRDLDRWHSRVSGVYLIAIASSENYKWPWSSLSNDAAEKVFAQTYPAIFSHLKKYEHQLRGRQDQGSYWWELRSCAYYKELGEGKLLIQSIAYHSAFCIGGGEIVPNNSAFFLPTTDLVTLAYLNSRIGWSYMYHVFPHKKDEAIAMDSAVVANFPLPAATSCDQIVPIVEDLVSLTQQRHQIETQFKEYLCTFNASLSAEKSLRLLQTETERFAENLRDNLDFDDDLKRQHSQARADVIAVHRKAYALEQALNGLIAKDYGLDENASELLDSMLPPRDPLSVLETKIAGKAELVADETISD